MTLKQRSWFALTSSTVVVAPVLVVLGVVMSLSNADHTAAYWLDLSSKATVGVLFLAPGFAALAAWDAARWRTLAVTPVRSWTEIAVVQALYVAVAATVTYTAALVLLQQQHPPATGWPHIGLIALAVWVTVAYSTVGLLVGRYVARLKAVPLAFGAVWLWVAYTPAVQPFWMRNVTGSIGTSCCSLDRQLAPGAVGAPLLLTAVLATTCVGLLDRATRQRVAAAVLSLVAAVGVAGWWVADLGADPVEARAGTTVCREGTELTACAWPEHAEALGAALPALEAAAVDLRRAGLRVPRRLEEDVPRDGWMFTISSLPAQQWADTLATSPVTAFPPACAGEPGWRWPYDEQQSTVAAWLLVLVGHGVKEAAESVGVRPDEVSAVLARSRAEQVEWYEESLRVMSHCERVP